MNTNRHQSCSGLARSALTDGPALLQRRHGRKPPRERGRPARTTLAPLHPSPRPGSTGYGARTPRFGRPVRFPPAGALRMRCRRRRGASHHCPTRRRDRYRQAPGTASRGPQRAQLLLAQALGETLHRRNAQRAQLLARSARHVHSQPHLAAVVRPTRTQLEAAGPPPSPRSFPIRTAPTGASPARAPAARTNGARRHPPRRSPRPANCRNPR